MVIVASTLVLRRSKSLWLSPVIVCFITGHCLAFFVTLNGGIFHRPVDHVVTKVRFCECVTDSSFRVKTRTGFPMGELT